MAKRLRINVTQRDIDRGVPGDCADCPIARAIRRHRGQDYAEVYGQSVEQADGSGVVYLPPEAVTFIENYDDYGLRGDREKCQPFSFVLEYDD